MSQLSDSKEKGLIDLRTPFAIVEVPDSAQNKGSGIRKGDIIIALNDYKKKYADEVKLALEQFKGQEVSAMVLRDGQQTSFPLNISKDGK